MSRRVVVIALIGLVLAGGSWVIWRGMRARPAPTSDAATSVLPPATGRVETPAAAPLPEPPIEPAPGSSTRPARRAPGPRAAAPVAPEPEAAPTLATLHIDSDVAGAQVFIDRNYVGVTPMTAADVAPGPHRLNIVAPGYDSIAENVDVQPGPRGLQFTFKEVRLDATIEVVHKHRIGSCTGRLVATPQGLRYETDHKDDRFSLPLGDLEVFDVDYLAKVLRVKLTKGKRYDFTDPGAANADRLFVFHRDVDKARQRLVAIERR